MSSGPWSGSAAPKVCLLLFFTLTVPTFGQHEHQSSAGIVVDHVETPESVAAMRQRLRELESTVLVMREQLDSTVRLAREAVAVQQSPSADMKETVGSKVPTEAAEPVEEQQPRGLGDITQDLAVELADLGTDLLLELGALAVLGTLFFLSSKARIIVPSSALKQMVAGKAPVGAAEKGCGRWVSTKITCDNLSGKVCTRETLLKFRALDLQDCCGAGHRMSLTTAHVDNMDHAEATLRPAVKPHRNTFRLSGAAQPSLRPSWTTEQPVPFKPLTQCLLQHLENVQDSKDMEPCNSGSRLATLRTEELDEAAATSEQDVKITNKEISKSAPAESYCHNDHARAWDSTREAAQPLVRPNHIGKEEKNAVEECSQVVQEGPELHIQAMHHEPSQDVLDQKHEGHVRSLEAQVVASEASQRVAAEEVGEIEMVAEAVKDSAKAENRQVGETPAELFESIESPEVPQNEKGAGGEKEEVVIASDEHFSQACDDVRSSAVGWLVAVSSWFAGRWPTPPAEASSSSASCDMPCAAPDCFTDKTGKAKYVNRIDVRAGKVAISRTRTEAKDAEDVLDFDEFEDDACSSLSCGQRLLGALVDSANTCRERWSCKAQQPEAQVAQAPRRGEKIGRKRGRQQPRTMSQKQQAAKAPAVGKPWQCPCGLPLTICITMMLAVCVLGRLDLDAIGLSPLLAGDDAAAIRASVLTGVVESAAAVQHEAIQRLEALKAEKSLLTLQHALLELESFQTEAIDMMAKHPGIPEASKLEGFTRDAKALHSALQELTGAEFPQVEHSYTQVLSRWKSTLASAKKRLAGGGSCTA